MKKTPRPTWLGAIADSLTALEARAARSRWLPFLLLGVALFAAALGLLRNYSYQNVLEIDAEIERGQWVELFANREQQETSIQIPVIPHERTVYRFFGLPEITTALRLDLTDQPGVPMRICRIRLHRGLRTLLEFRGDQMGPLALADMTWSPAGGTDGEGCIRAVSLSRDPMLRIGPDCFAWSYSWRARLFDRVCEHAWLPLIFISLLWLLFHWRSFFPYLHLPVGALLIVALQGYLWRARLPRELLTSWMSSDVAVGAANYAGFAKAVEHRIMLLSCVISVGLGWLAARWLAARWPGGAPFDASATIPSASPAVTPSFGAWRIVVGLLVAGLFLLNLGVRTPDVVGSVTWMESTLHHPQFDGMNHFTWGYAAFAGWEPLRDFWYPYSGLLPMNRLSHWGPLLRVGHIMLTWTVIAGCGYFLARRSLSFVALLLASGLLAFMQNQQYGEARYNLALGLLLIGLVGRQSLWSWRSAVLFALFAGYCLPIEIPQIFYASAALGVIWLLDLLSPRSGMTRAQLLRWLGIAAVTFVLPLSLWLLDLSFSGRLTAQLEFLRQGGSMVAYASTPSEIWNWFVLDGGRDSLLLYATLITLASGAFLRTFRKEGPLEHLGTICLACGLLSAVAIHKQVMRPHIALQLIEYVELPMLFLFWQLCLQSRRIADRVAVICSLMLIMMAATGISPWINALQATLLQLESVPSGVTVLADSSRIERAERAYYFDQKKYAGLEPLLQRLRTLITGRYGLESVQSSTEDRLTARPVHSTFYVLGDESYLYAALHQKPPYYISIYDSSPLPAQQRMQRWLEDEKPEFVVWRPLHVAFDTVPNIVRVPLLYAAVIAGYEPLERIGEYHILRRRPIAAPVNIAYWRETLGDSIALGALPAHSRLGQLPPCNTSPSAGDPTCAEVLHLHVEQPEPSTPLQLPVVAAAERFVLSLQPQTGVHDYYLPLSRLWFWPLLTSTAQAGQTAPPAWSAPPGTSLSIESRQGAAALLF